MQTDLLPYPKSRDAIASKNGLQNDGLSKFRDFHDTH